MIGRNGIGHVVWDWNGTLLDDTDACVEAINCMLAKRRLPAVDRARYRELFGFPVKDYYLAVGFDLEGEDWDAVAREFHEHYGRAARAARLRAGIVELLGGLRGRGIPMSVLSASEQGILDRMIAERGIAACFDRVCGVQDLHGRSKLDVGLDLIRAIGMDGARVVLVGDTAHDHEVASRMGCRCLLLEGGHQAGHRLRRHGCPVAANLSELAGFFDL